MGRRTKDQIEIDKEMTCSKRGCNKICEEVYLFTSYNYKAVHKDLHDLPFCEKHFKELEEKLNKI